MCNVTELSSMLQLACLRGKGRSLPPESQFNGGLSWTVKVPVNTRKSHFDEGRMYAGFKTCSEERPGHNLSLYKDFRIMKLNLHDYFI
jgi:hypothetical protein